ncbi:MAG: peptidoglycan-associated lipoprotein Pal [Terracidiphilus sp.]|jgi:peptidoglycan-associated lipoprotein
MRLEKIFVLVVLMVALVGAAGCGNGGKKHKPLPPEETAPPATVVAPTAKLTATPTQVSAGDQIQLSWHTTDATSVSIDGIGDVPTAGVKTVTPTDSTSYHLVARGDGGTAEATARVTVNAPPAVVVPTKTMSPEEEFKASVQDIFFDYDTYDIRSEALNTLAGDAAYLMGHPELKIVIGGYCDERGSNEYNLALGQNRADAARKALIAAGVSADRIRVVSYGKEKPFCAESNEACWQQNRRDGFTIDR